MTGGNPSPPGWYPDPLTGGTRNRWWTGRDWGDEVSPQSGARPVSATTPARSTGPTAPGRRNRRRGVPWLRIFAFVIASAVVIFALASGHLLRSVNLLSGEITFYSGSAGTDREDVESGQAEIEQRHQELEKSARSTAPTQPIRPNDATLAGLWTGDNNLQYAIEQFRTQVVIVERGPYGVTAVGYGTVDGTQVNFYFEALDGSTGIGALSLVDGRTLAGTFTNYDYGLTVEAVIRR
jgi:Protein of unknown function (DUF2510)